MADNRKVFPSISSNFDRRVFVRYREDDGEVRERQIQLSEFPVFCRSIYRSQATTSRKTAARAVSDQ